VQANLHDVKELSAAVQKTFLRLRKQSQGDDAKHSLILQQSQEENGGDACNRYRLSFAGREAGRHWPAVAIEDTEMTSLKEHIQEWIHTHNQRFHACEDSIVHMEQRLTAMEAVYVPVTRGSVRYANNSELHAAVSPNLNSTVMQVQPPALVMASFGEMGEVRSDEFPSQAVSCSSTRGSASEDEPLLSNNSAKMKHAKQLPLAKISDLRIDEHAAEESRQRLRVDLALSAHTPCTRMIPYNEEDVAPYQGATKTRVVLQATGGVCDTPQARAPAHTGTAGSSIVAKEACDNYRGLGKQLCSLASLVSQHLCALDQVCQVANVIKREHERLFCIEGHLKCLDEKCAQLDIQSLQFQNRLESREHSAWKEVK